MNRDPKELIERAQIHLMLRRRGLRFIEQVEWDNLTEAIAVLETCLKLLKKEKN
jgi:hypothetical protein